MRVSTDHNLLFNTSFSTFMVRIISQLVEFIQYSGVNIYGQNNQSVVSKMVEFGEMTFLVNV